MAFWANLAGYQAVWFAAVIGAGRGLAWPGVLAALVFAAAHLAWTRQRRADLVLMAAAAACGLLIDGGLALAGLMQHAAAAPAVPPGGAPLWILALWCAFALTLNHSLVWLRGRPWLAAAFGAVGAPLAYLGAARGWRAVAIETPLAWLGLAAGWALALGLLATVARRLQPMEQTR
ncbi:hypothetical protein CEG14_21845 [Bordetella genomosp. 1]|uniref:DUF2878 domain-containing protein n=1 Tax=Bordetella genomosp. 1 TaxID=1395607 RepID=A0A261RW00_9BORD|nr:DUF2878 domain-containing protein [Bordetella genomosp. 1]OZI29266.1 hypothetical protein CEG14_21845 [Bordetella genomosp. 1]